MKLIINCETGEETFAELTAEDLSQQQIDNEKHILMVQEREQLLALKVAAYKKIGLNDQEIGAILPEYAFKLSLEQNS
jgi:hypothetical protein